MQRFPRFNEGLQIEIQISNLTGLEHDWTGVYAAVRWIQFIMAILSILGSGSIITYAAFQNLIKTPEIRPLFYLSFTDLLLGVSWLVGAVLYREPLGSQNVACYNLQSIGQIFYVSSFFYTINYTWVLYTDLKEKYNRTVNGFSQVGSNHAYRISRIMTILSGVIPVLLMAPVFWGGNVAKCYQNFSQPYKCLLMHTGTLEPDTGYNESDTKVCHAMHYYGIGVFLLTFFCTFTGIVVLLVKARSLYKRFVNSSGFLGDQQWVNISVIERRVILYPTAFFCCWGPAVVLETVKLFNPTGQEKFYVSLYILQAFTSASQGILNCFVYGFTQHMIRFMKNKTSRDVDTQTPLLRSQKKCYASRHSISTGTSQTTG
ncbi:transmembrane protein 116-like isoform X1 [Polyodon spathula]|uniref:transmembrane protein 116-like isoform X1 n=2 Tax=Polyodon spathula TaxID=7913 RepID=UPI001B7DD771|nr:transmembrane protein 116-like isoform X1 [Polyodon spathula]